MKFLAILFLTLLCTYSLADDLTLPNTFTAGTPARAAEVNENFSAIEASVDDNDSRLLALEAAISLLAASVDDNDSRLLALEAAISLLEARVFPPLGTCQSTRLEALNGVFIACDPILVNGGPALTFDLLGRTINYDGIRIVVNAWTQYSEQDCDGLVGIQDQLGAGILNVYGLSENGDVYVSDGTTPISWTRMSKVLNASGVYVCSNESLTDSGVFFEAELVLDHLVYPTPYRIVPETL